MKRNYKGELKKNDSDYATIKSLCSQNIIIASRIQSQTTWGNACREYDRGLVSLLSVMFVQVDKRNMVILEA